MAKSFHTILKEGTIDVNHKGEDVTFDLPTWLTSAMDLLEDEQKLLAWAQTHEVLHGLMHFGIQQLIIALRAAARPTVKVFKDVDKAKAFMATIKDPSLWHINTSQDEFSKVMSAELEKVEAQKRIDEFVLKAVPKPGTSKAAVAAAVAAKAEQDVLIRTIEAMRKVGQQDDVILNTLAPAFGEEKVNKVMNG